MNLILVIQVYKSSNTCQKDLLIKDFVVHKLPNFDASVLDDFSKRGGYGYTFHYRALNLKKILSY